MNEFSKALVLIGVSVKNQDGSYRYFGDILNDLCEKWRNLTVEQKDAVSSAFSGEPNTTVNVTCNGNVAATKLIGNLKAYSSIRQQ